MSNTSVKVCELCQGPNTRGWGARYCSTKCQKRGQARDRKANIVRRAKAGKPCTDCGITWPYYVMQFDHVPERGPKLFNLSYITGRSQREILEEMAKCDLVCANCHMIRTQIRATSRPGLTVALVAVERAAAALESPTSVRSA